MHDELETVETKLRDCMKPDQRRLRRRIVQLRKQHGETDQAQLAALKQALEEALLKKEQKAARKPEIEFPPHLPVTEKIHDIRLAVSKHPVTVVCGETGSGKSTQLPKLCMQMGYGLHGLIGHTQPRRIAARSIADRIASETGSRLGEDVGYRIRHTDRTSAMTWIKVMTDGVLLSEMQSDRWLNDYEVLIIDEAHERSLNIDFLLGYLKLLIARRPDIKLIITSATIDVKRFSEFFDNAPVVEVSGRSYPVEIRYQPVEEDESEDEVARGKALLQAIVSLEREGQGDILVFLDGEREIRDMQKFLQKQKLPGTDILPLYARLSGHEQAKIFRPHKRRHIILATNVAETSLTIDGIRFVIDFGLARISRYSYRSKVQRLPIEKISRASARQRAGRCGRTSEGICIRLYPEEDFEQRPEFTDPEILRTNLAAVILQMKALELGDIRDFEFIDPPDRKFINDGLRLLNELGALDKPGKLTRIGRLMSRLPVDPRLARMILAAREWNCLTEVLVIVSALAIQDPKERPLDRQEQADRAHAGFAHGDSDFIWYLNFWQFYHRQAGKLSRNQLQKLCKQNFVSAVRMLEWQDIHEQLSRICREQGMRFNQEEASYANIHCAILSGLSSHIALKTDDNVYTGARNTRLNIFPGSGQFKKQPKWIMGYELVETTRLYARIVAKIDPGWLLKTAAHLLQREYSEPCWNTDKQQVLIREKISLYGLVISAGKTVSCAQIDPSECRKIFIREALVHQELNSGAAFFRHNRKLMDAIRQLEIKRRRPDLLDEDKVYNFYDRVLPSEVCSPESLEQWRRDAEQASRRILYFRREDIIRDQEATVNAREFPDELRMNNLVVPVNYRFEPGDENDGVSIDLPVYALNQLSENSIDRLVPGLLEEKVIGLLKSLPKSQRKQLVPLPDTARECLESISGQPGPLLECLGEFLRRRYGIEVSGHSWDEEKIPAHLRMNIRVINDDGECIARGRDLDSLRKELSEQASEVFTVPDAHPVNRSGLTDWDFDELPEQVEIEINGSCLPGYPALIDETESVAIRTLDTRAQAEHESVQGLRRLLMFRLAKDLKYLRKHLPHIEQIRLLYTGTGSSDALTEDLIRLILDRVFIEDRPLPRDRQAFESLIEQGIIKLVSEGNRITKLVHGILCQYRDIRSALADMRDRAGAEVTGDIRGQLESLVFDGFLGETPVKWLQHYPRYLSAIERRIEKLEYSAAGELQRIREVQQFETIYAGLVPSGKTAGSVHPEIEHLRWMIQEYRVSLFAQELKTCIPVSAKRLEKQIEKIRQS